MIDAAHEGGLLPEDRVPFEHPESYDDALYELLIRWIESAGIDQLREVIDVRDD